MVPQPPINFIVPVGGQIAFGIFLALFNVYWLYIAVEHWRKEGSPLAVLVLAGGGIACLMELIVDILGLCYLGDEGIFPLYTAFGRKFPLWVLPAYIWFFGGLSWAFVRKLKNGDIDKKKYWKFIGSVFVANLIIEIAPLQFGMYTYYGNQPFQIFKFPIWWLTANGVGPLVAAVFIYRMQWLFRGPRVFLALVVPIMAYGVSFMATSAPLAVALNSGVSTPVVWLAGAVTMGLGFFIYYILSLFVCIDSPMRNA